MNKNNQIDRNYKTMHNINSEIKTFKQIVDLIPKTYLTAIKFKNPLEANLSSSLKISTDKSENISEKEKVLNPLYQSCDIKPKKRIKEIKMKLSSKNLNFPIINSKYRDLVQDSSNLIKEKKSLFRNMSIDGKAYSLSKFMNENKEITIKNYLLEVLKTEKNNLILTENKISKALIESDTRLEEDYNNFKRFTEDIKNKHKEMDNHYYELNKEGREYYKQKKKLMQENKQLMDEVDRTVKMIFNLKEYAIFIHRVLGDENFKFTKNSKDNKNMEFEEFSFKEKDLDKLTENLM